MNRQRPDTIDYCDYTWNPITGCYHNCPYCYARRIAHRFARRAPMNLDSDSIAITYFSSDGLPSHRIYGPSTPPFPFGFTPTFYENRLREPLRLHRPSVIFTVDMGDLLGAWVPDPWIYRILDVMATASHHTFLVLTKNPKRLSSFHPWPNNVWVGTTIESQEQAESRIPLLLETLAPVRWVSLEPLLGPIDLTFPAGPLWDDGREMQVLESLDWVVVGAMTGPGATPPSPAWISSLVDQCAFAGTPLWIKNNVHWPSSIKCRPPTSRTDPVSPRGAT